MPLHVLRLRDSDLMALSSGEEFKAAVSLWCVAWHQEPAGSLPKDDRMLARHSGAGKDWPKLKAMALRGWYECSDGRLYHPVICEAVVDALKRQEQYRETAENEVNRKQRYRNRLKEISEQLRALGVPVPRNRSLDHLEAVLREAVAGTGGVPGGDSSGDSSGDDVSPAGMAKTGTGTGTGTRTIHTRGARTPASRGTAVELHSHPVLSAGFDEAFLDTTYPATSHSRNVVDGVHRAQGLVGGGLITEQLLRSRLEGFRAFVDSGGYSGPDKVPSLRNWLDRHHPEKYWARDWAAVPSKAQQAVDSTISEGMAFLRTGDSR